MAKWQSCKEIMRFRAARDGDRICRELRWHNLHLPARSLIYRLYEHRLLAQVRASPLPRHVGIILDGNRRFAQRYNLTSPQEIYTAGAQKLDDLLDWCVDLGLGAITLWVLSTDNFNRDAEELSGILAAARKQAIGAGERSADSSSADLRARRRAA